MGGGDRAIRRADRDRSGGLTGRSRYSARGPPLILCRGTELVDGYGTDQICSSGRGQVLIRWPNRLQDSTYEFDGLHHQLSLNELQRRNAIHGLVRWLVWTATKRDAHRVVMEHVLQPQPG